MKIQSLNLYNISPKCSKINFSASHNDEKNSHKNFEIPNEQIPYFILNQIKQSSQALDEFLNKKGKVTLEQYNQILENNPQVLSRCYSICRNMLYKQSNCLHTAKAAVNLKEYYDKKYDNYTILSIGTSPAPITEVMQNLGCKVIFLPITNLRNIDDGDNYPLRNAYPTITSRYKNIGKLMRYLTKKGINKKNTGKILILDYSFSGNTLNLIEKILQQRGDINPRNIQRHSLIDDLNRTIEESKNTTNLTNNDIAIIKFCSNLLFLNAFPVISSASTFHKYLLITGWVPGS